MKDKKSLKNWIWECLGLHLGGFGQAFKRDLEALGETWAVSKGLLFMLVFGVVFKSALGASGLDFGSILMGFGRIFGRVLEGFWEGVGGICEHCWAEAR